MDDNTDMESQMLKFSRFSEPIFEPESSQGSFLRYMFYYGYDQTDGIALSH